MCEEFVVREFWRHTCVSLSRCSCRALVSALADEALRFRLDRVRLLLVAEPGLPPSRSADLGVFANGLFARRASSVLVDLLPVGGESSHPTSEPFLALRMVALPPSEEAGERMRGDRRVVRGSRPSSESPAPGSRGGDPSGSFWGDDVEMLRVLLLPALPLVVASPLMPAGAAAAAASVGELDRSRSGLASRTISSSAGVGSLKLRRRPLPPVSISSRPTAS